MKGGLRQTKKKKKLKHSSRQELNSKVLRNNIKTTSYELEKYLMLQT